MVEPRRCRTSRPLKRASVVNELFRTPAPSGSSAAGPKPRPSCLLCIGVLLITVTAVAQKTEPYKVRLTPVSMDTAMKVNIAGSGAATGTLAGNKLSVSGTFEGLLSPATTAQIHRGSATGVRGPVIFDLTVSQAAKGSISGSFDLTADQAESLRKGRIYVEIASQKAPDGNLWGWLLP